MAGQPPRWDVRNVYPSLASKAFRDAVADLDAQVDALERFFARRVAKAGPRTPVAGLAKLVADLIRRRNAAGELAGTLGAYVNAFLATDSFDAQAKRIGSALDRRRARLRSLEARAAQFLGRIAARVPALLKRDPTLAAHAFHLAEAIEDSRYLMAEGEESLAAELGLSGATAWGKLQGVVTSQLTVDFAVDGAVRRLPMPALINYRSHPDEATRRRAWETENAAWETVKEPLAAALNGVKGADLTLNARRGYADALHPSIRAARIDRATLEAMLGAMRDSLPLFRRYFRAKAARLGKERLAWWDLFAPAGRVSRTFTWDEARAFILRHLEGFSPDLAGLARRAFDEGWIDAEMRPGKRGGAFCMGVPGVRQSRILANFDGSLAQVGTLAHELGHAYHNHCLYRAGKTPLQRVTPMTLAETASILCETLVSQAVLAAAPGPDEELAILEDALQGASQVIVDIYSRYLFEKAVYERRAEAELSADEFGDLMERAQETAYGDALDPRYRQRFMWTWKPHYYSASLAFYNYPYAFGQLFGTGLYAIYRQRGEAFLPDYTDLLASTGEADAADLAARFGIDIRRKRFWADSIAVIGRQVDRYCAL